eukprot:470508_1
MSAVVTKLPYASNAVSVNDIPITKDVLKEKHKHHKLTAGNKNIFQLLQILGGCNELLDTLLSHDILTQKQMTEIHQLLVSAETPTADLYSQQTNLQFAPVGVANNTDSKQELITQLNATTDHFYYQFYTSDTYLHSMFSPDTAMKLINFALSKKIIYSIFTLICVWIILQLIFKVGQTPITVIYGICMCPFIIALELLVVFSSNREAFKLVRKQFVFYFKVVYSFYFGVLSAIYYAFADETKYKTLAVIEICLLLGFVLPLFIIIVSMFDAINVSRFTKSFSSITIAVVLSGWTYYFSWHTDWNDKLIFGNISLREQIGSALRVLSIFLWSQAWSTVKYSKKKTEGIAKCAMIRYTPWMKWINDDTNTNEIQLQQMNQNHQIKIENEDVKSTETQEKQEENDAK